MSFALAACGKKKEPVALAAPVVSVSTEGKAEWKAIENASGYAYKINDGDEKATNETSVTLTDGQSIQVKAVGDGTNYSDSAWSVKVTYKASTSGGNNNENNNNNDNNNNNNEDEKLYGTLENPLSVAAALELADSECDEKDAFTRQVVYMKGKSNNTPVFKTSKTGDYYQNLTLVDLEDSSKSILVYTINVEEGVAAPVQNDVLLICGYIKNHNGTTIEFAAKTDEDTNESTYVYLKSNTRGTSAITLGDHEGAEVKDLPETAVNGSTVEFTVTASEGKILDTVKVYSKEISPDETTGKYSFVVEGNATVTAETHNVGEKAAVELAKLAFTGDEKSNDGSVSGYTSSFEATRSGITWLITNFNNNSNAATWTFIKTGHNKNATVGTIDTKDMLVDYITKVVVNIDGSSKDYMAEKVNKFRLDISTTNEFAEGDIIESVTATIAVGDVEFKIATPVANHYYRIVVDCAPGSDNGYVVVNSVSYWGNENEAAHRHNWVETNKHDEGEWTHSSKCDVAGCEFENGIKTAPCNPVLNVCSVCDYEYKADEIVEALYALENSNDSLPGTYSLTGVVTEIVTAYTSSNGVTFKYTVAGKTILAYRTKDVSNTQTPYAPDVAVGYTVTVQGGLKLYNGDYEFNYGTITALSQNARYLAAPVVSIDENGNATWAKQTGAASYVYQIKESADGNWSEDKNDAQEDNGTYSVKLNDGWSIQVKAKGDEDHDDSAWSTTKTYSQDPMTYDEFVAAAKGADVYVTGVVTGIATGTNSSNIYLEDSDGAYYIYGATGDVLASLAIGNTISVRGTKAEFNGLLEIENATIAILDTATVTPNTTDITSTLEAATALNADSLKALQGKYITIKGVTLDSVNISGNNSQYYNLYFTLDGNASNLKFYLYYNITGVNIDNEDLTELYNEFNKNLGRKADIVGYVTWNNGFRIVPAVGCLDVDETSKFPLGKPSIEINNQEGKVTWDKVDGATGYEYQLLDPSNSGWGEDTDVLNTNIEEVDGKMVLTLSSDKNGWSVRVRALNNATESDREAKSAWSNEVTYNADAAETTDVMINFTVLYAHVANEDNNATEVFNNVVHRKDDVTVVASNDQNGATGGTAPTYYQNGASARVYNNNTLTVSAGEQTIREIVITSPSGQSFTATVEVGALAAGDNNTQVWTGAASTVTFKIGATSRITTIKVTYDDPEYSDEQKAEKAFSYLPEDIDFNLNGFTVPVAGEFGTTIEWSVTLDDGSTSSDAVTIDAQGNATVTRSTTDVVVKLHAVAKINDKESSKKTYGPFTVVNNNTTVKEWQKVTNISQLDLANNKDGLQIVITNAAGTLALGPQSNNNNNRTAVDFSTTGPLSQTDVQVITLLPGSGSNKYYLQVEDNKYLYAASTSSSSYLRAKADPTDCTIVIESNESATVQFATDSGITRNIIRFNSTLFNCYASGQSDICIYVYA